MKHDDDVQALRCADCARSDSAVTDLEPTQTLPIPAEALTGDLQDLPGRAGINRRALLRNGLLGFASVYSASMLRASDIWEAALAEAAEPMQKSLVCIFLNGGNDSLNTIVPLETTQFDAYTKARANIARTRGASSGAQVGTTAIPGTGGALGFANVLVSGTGNNGATKGLDTLFGDGSGGAGSDLAIFPAADYTPANRSHFESRDYWFAGALQQMQTGWLGRWLDAYGSGDNPLQAISLGSSLSKQIRSSTAPVSALEGLGGARFTTPGAAGQFDATGEVGRLAGVAAGNDALARARSIYGLTVDVSTRLGSLQAPAAGAGYPPNSDLSRRLQLAATLLAAGLGTRIITIDWGSFDTHGDQPGSQDPQLSTLSRALAAFKDDLAARGVEQNVVTMVFSEFGRRIASNDSRGTDHGAGGVMMLSGSAVRGGMLGDHPGVTQTDDNGDLRVATDFRSVYSGLITDWLGGDPGAILPGGVPGLGKPLIG
jgi:uncharacterized protein (DUF1501 family)